jgi:hypothetical protein
MKIQVGDQVQFLAVATGLRPLAIDMRGTVIELGPDGLTARVEYTSGTRENILLRQINAVLKKDGWKHATI